MRFRQMTVAAAVPAFLVSLLASSPVRAQELADVSGHRTLSVAIQVDRDSARLVGFTLKEHPFVAPGELPSAKPYLGKGESVQIEVVLLGPGGTRYSRRVTMNGLCLDHGPEVGAEIEGDTFRLHRESLIVELPEIAGFDQVEVAYYRVDSKALARTTLGSAELDAAHFTSGGTKVRYSDLLIAKPAPAKPLSVLTPGTLHLPEEFGDPDIYTVSGDAGETSKRINVVVVPDGYTHAQKADLQADFAAMVSAFRAKSPYKEHDRFFNYILVYAYSTEDGTDQCDCSIVRDTAMSTRFPLVTATCGHDDNRCLSYGGGCDPTDSSANIATVELRSPAQDTTVVMVNTTRYGGCGGARAVYSAGNASATEIAIHELGHSLAGLADEYGGDPSCGAGAGINVSTDSVNGNWPEWIGDLGAPLEGAKYYDQCIYRPVPACEMRVLNSQFCPVCKQQWALTIFGHGNVSPTAPLESQSPASPAFTNVGMPLTFSLGTRLATGPAVTNDFTWKLQGPGYPVATTIATGTDSLTRSFSPAGTYTLTSEIVADTNFIKPVKNGANVDTATFTAEVCEPTLACNGGGPYSVECSGGSGTVELHGSAPTDESLRYFWTTDCPGGSFSDPTDKDATLTLDGPPPCPVSCTVTLNAVHDCETSYICSSSVTVVDTTPPAVTAPDPLALECNSPGGVLKTDPQVVAWLTSATAVDSCNSASLSDNAPDLIPAGCGAGSATIVTFTGTDACLNADTDDSSVTVADTSGPVIDVQPQIAGGHAYLWPPQHGYVDFTLTGTGIAAHDVCDGVRFEFSSCQSSQPENATGGGDGNSIRDCVFDATSVHLRAERDGGCAPLGRTYTMTIDAIDDCGNRTHSAPFLVVVPHDLGHQGPGTQFSANPHSNQNDTRPGTNGTYGPACAATSQAKTALFESRP